MELAKKINKMIRQISYEIGTALPNVDNNGVCSLRYNGKFDFIIEIPQGSQYIFFYSTLLERTETSSQFHERLLQHNFMCEKTDGATLCLDKDNDDIILCRMYDSQNITLEKLRKYINLFLSTAEKYFAKVSKWIHYNLENDSSTKKTLKPFDPSDLFLKV